MSAPNYELLNATAYLGSVEEFKELLLKHGDDKNAMLAILAGLDGESIIGLSLRNGLPAVFEGQKRAALEDYRNGKNEFAPGSLEGKLTSDYNKMAARVAELEQENVQLKRDLAVEKTKTKPTEYPSIH